MELFLMILCEVRYSDTKLKSGIVRSNIMLIFSGANKFDKFLFFFFLKGTLEDGIKQFGESCCPSSITSCKFISNSGGVNFVKLAFNIQCYVVKNTLHDTCFFCNFAYWDHVGKNAIKVYTGGVSFC